MASPDLADLVEQLASLEHRNDAIRGLVGGLTATELRGVETLPEPVFAALVDGLAHPNPKVRWWCVQLLDHVPDRRALAALAAVLDDPVPRVRRNAAHALGCLACKPGAEADVPDDVLSRLARLAEADPSAKVRREAAWALQCRLPHYAGPSPKQRGKPVNGGRTPRFSG